MDQLSSVIVHKGGKFYVAECPEVGTVSQGKNIEEAIKNLKEAEEVKQVIDDIERRLDSV